MSPSDTSSGSGNTALVSIIVAIIAVVGTIAAAIINKAPDAHQPSQTSASSSTGPAAPSGPVANHPGGAGDRPALNPQMGPLLINSGYVGGTDYRSFHSNNAAQCSDACRKREPMSGHDIGFPFSNLLAQNWNHAAGFRSRFYIGD